MTFILLLTLVLATHVGPSGAGLLSADLAAHCRPGRGRHRRQPRHTVGRRPLLARATA